MNSYINFTAGYQPHQDMLREAEKQRRYLRMLEEAKRKVSEKRKSA